MFDLSTVIGKELICLNIGSKRAYSWVNSLAICILFEGFHGCYLLENKNSTIVSTAWLEAEFIFVQSIIQHVLIWNGVTFKNFSPWFHTQKTLIWIFLISLGNASQSSHNLSCHFTPFHTKIKMFKFRQIVQSYI